MAEQSYNSSSSPLPETVMCNHSVDYKWTAYTVVYSLVFILGLLGNAGALYVFCKLSVKNRLSTIILINLAVSDLVFVLTLPVRVGFYLRELWAGSGGSGTSAGLPPHTQRDMDVLDLACRASTYLFYISMYCCIYFLTALSVCRYLVLSGRLSYHNLVYCRRVRLLCLGIWVFVVGGTGSYIAALGGFNVAATGCFEPSTHETWSFLYQVNLLVLVVGFAMPLVLVLLCYALMIRHILRAQSGRRARDVALVCLVLLVFLMCFLPYHIQRTLHLEYVHRADVPCEVKAKLQQSVVVTMCFAAANSCLDPLIFLFVGNGFMRVVREILQAWGFRDWPWRKGSYSANTGNLSCEGAATPPMQPIQLPLMPAQPLIPAQPLMPAQPQGTELSDSSDRTSL